MFYYLDGTVAELLPFPGGDHPLADNRAGFAGGSLEQFILRQLTDRYPQIDTVEQRTGNAASVIVD